MKIAMLGLKGLPATFGGVERYSEEVATRLAARGHEVFVYCRGHYTPKDVARQPYRGVTLVRQPTLHTKTADTLTHTGIATLDLMRRRVDVAHYHSLGPGVFAWLPRLMRIPTVVQIHNQEWRGEQNTWGTLGKTFFRLADSAAMQFPTATAAISRTHVEYYRKTRGKELAFTSTGVTMPPPADMQQDVAHLTAVGLLPENYLFFAARLVPEKGLHMLIDAYERLNPNLPLVIAGDGQGAYADSLRSHASDKIRFLGYRFGDELHALFRNAYLYVHPAFREGLALSVLEAMAHQCCVLASDIPENLEPLAGHGYTFRVNDPADLVSQLARLIAQPDLVQAERAVAAQHVAQHYSWEAVVDRLELIYAALAAKRPLPLAELNAVP